MLYLEIRICWRQGEIHLHKWENCTEWSILHSEVWNFQLAFIWVCLISVLQRFGTKSCAQHQCTGSKVGSWLSTLVAWPDLKLTWPSWNSRCRCYQLSEVSHWQLIICALHGGRCWGRGQRLGKNYSRREPGCLYVTACFKYLLQSRFLQLSLL